MISPTILYFSAFGIGLSWPLLLAPFRRKPDGLSVGQIYYLVGSIALASALFYGAQLEMIAAHGANRNTGIFPHVAQLTFISSKIALIAWAFYWVFKRKEAKRELYFPIFWIGAIFSVFVFGLLAAGLLAYSMR